MRGINTFLLFLAFWGLFQLQSPAAEYSSANYGINSQTQVEFQDYMKSIKEKIQKNWNNPEFIAEGRVVLQFKITRNGDLFAYDIKESSGNVLLDEFAVNVLQKSAPFGEFPKASRKDFITLVYTFDSSLVKTDKIKELVEISEKFINVDNQKARNLIDEAISETQGDSIAYFLYARRYNIDKLMCDTLSAKKDLEECKRLKDLYDKRRILTCQKGVEENNTAFSHFALANAYDLAGNYDKAISEIDRAIAMTDLNHAYKRYRAEIVSRNK